MQLSPDHCLAPKYPSASAGLSIVTKNWAPWPSCPRDHSLCSTKMPSAADITAVSSIHATLLADHVSRCLTRMAWPLTDSASLFQKNILRLADRDDPTSPACSYRSIMLRILLKGFSICDLASQRVGDGVWPDPHATIRAPNNLRTS